MFLYYINQYGFCDKALSP